MALLLQYCCRPTELKSSTRGNTFAILAFFVWCICNFSIFNTMVHTKAKHRSPQINQRREQTKLNQDSVKVRNVLEKEKHQELRDTNSSIQILEPWTPSLLTAFKALLSARLCAAIWSNISDCDETYNYWEPTHYLMYGSGFQTWEYSPVYAIRSYAYLWLHALPGLVYSYLLQSNKILVFYYLRCVLAFLCALCEVFFYKGVCKQFGAHTGRVTLCFLIMSTGMFISSAAYLPSTFSMYMTMLSCGAWFMYKYELAIFCTAISTFVGWPFSCIIGLPIAYDILIRRKRTKLFIKWCMISVAVILAPLVHIDTSHYGKLVIAPFNIVWYNVFTDQGPDIYGVEPWTFYFLNSSLNFNLIFPAAIISLPLTLFVRYVIKLHKKQQQYLPSYVALAPLYLWIIVFFTRPHKEERFLFPIYPLFCLCGAVTVDAIQKLYYHLMVKEKTVHYLGRTNWIAIIFCILTSLLSISRSVALHKAYNAPMEVYMEINKLYNEELSSTTNDLSSVNLCVGKEWYRFPSSFFLPHESWHLQFIKSEFRGQLPQQFSNDINATMMIPEHMNDRNLEETSRYFDVRKCAYLVDLDVPMETSREPRYAEKLTEWEIIMSIPFLDNKRSHRLYRSFYIPWLTENNCKYNNYNLLRAVHTRVKKADHKKHSRS